MVRRIVTLGWVVLCATACAPAASSVEAPLRVYVTTGHLADAVVAIAPGASVGTLVGPGGDPHTYQPSTRDIQRILDADLVVSIGIGLEPHLDDLMQRVGERYLAVGELVPDGLLLDLPGKGAGAAGVDPHIWNSPAAWRVVVEQITEALVEIDPPGEAGFVERAAAYTEDLDAAAEQARSFLTAISPDRRVLVTGHDAFAYFGEAFGLEVHATDFISTEARISAGELSQLADLVADRRIPVVFHDSQANPQAITSLTEAVRARGWDVMAADAELYADSLGTDEGVDTHLEVLVHNARVIARGLEEGEP